jgi:hypothetical protein
MPRPERPLDPMAGPRELFAYELRQLRKAAGSPTYQQMAEQTHYSRSALSEAAGGRTFPSWDVTRAFVLACNSDEREWEQRWAAVQGPAPGAAGAALLERPVQSSPPSERAGAATGSRQVRRWRSRESTRWILLPLALALVVGAILFGRQPIPATASVHSTFLGDVDLSEYCRTQGYQSASLDGATAVDWHCARPPTTKDSLSVIDACRQRYHKPSAVARYDDLDNPYSWQCWDNVVILGRVDLSEFCRADGFSTATLDGSTLASWHCVSSSGVHVSIDEDSACRWQYGPRALVASPAHFHSPWEKWDCWG